ncbi:MAG: hypothetical protein LUD25_02230 [Coriobacteriaceae bacterium]|nr:hypothetical protein [Coriobacteriaceae bacterium]
MPRMPINIQELFETATNIGEERELPVYLDIVVDATASDALIDTVLEAFPETGVDVFVERIVLEDTVPEIPLPCDLCVIIAGESLLLGNVAHAARQMGIPTVLAISEGETYFSAEPPSLPTVSGRTDREAADEQGIPVGDIVLVDLQDEQPRLDALAQWIIKNAPAKRLSLADDFPFLRHALAMEMVQSTSIQNAAVGVVFFVPGADMPVMTLNQAKMVLQLASIYGQELDRRRIKEIAAVVAGAFGLRTAARQVSGLLPAFGWAAKAAIAYSGTLAMGRLAAAYFEDGGVVSGLEDALSGVSDKATEIYENLREHPEDFEDLQEDLDLDPDTDIDEDSVLLP